MPTNCTIKSAPLGLALIASLVLFAASLLPVSGEETTPTPVVVPSTNGNGSVDSEGTDKRTAPNNTLSSLHCLVCNSNPALKSKDPTMASKALYDPDCRYPTPSFLTIDSNPRVINCNADFPAKINDYIGFWRKEQGYVTPQSGGLDVGCTSDNGSYSVCASMYYEANLDYYYLNDTSKSEKFTGDNELVLRFCACVEPEMLEKVQKSGKVCKETKRGLIRRRMCYCDPNHPSFQGKTCNRSVSLTPPPHFSWIAIFAILKYFTTTTVSIIPHKMHLRGTHP